MYNAVPIIMLRRVIDAHGGIVLRRNANSVTMPTCVVLLCHLRKLQFSALHFIYAVAYSYLLCTLASIIIVTFIVCTKICKHFI